MAHTYKTLTPEQLAQLADNQLAQFESEIFGHEMNIKRLEALPVSKQNEDTALLIQNAKDAIASIQHGIKVTTEERNQLRAKVDDKKKTARRPKR